jgi:hypothetical protein
MNYSSATNLRINVYKIFKGVQTTIQLQEHKAFTDTFEAMYSVVFYLPYKK